jgi:uncharacterized protein (DUF1800 family)
MIIIPRGLSIFRSTTKGVAPRLRLHLLFPVPPALMSRPLRPLRAQPCLALLLAFSACLPALPGAQFGTDRVLNLSSRARAGVSADALIAGFVIGPGAPKQVLIRAVGPSLAPFNVAGLLANPKLEVFDSAGIKVLENDDWGTIAGGPVPLASDFAAVGAFALTGPSSQDAAVLATLPSGGYTVQVSGATGESGVALVEVYDVSGGAQLMNLSTRARVQSGSQIVISGLVVAPGSGLRKMLVRAAGPSLDAFGLTGTLADPVLTLLDSAGRAMATNDNWADAGRAPAIAAAGTAAGAFAFSGLASRDAAMLVDLPPGGYTLQVTGAGNSSGLALVEVYDLTPKSIALVSVAASRPSTDSSGGAPGAFTLTREGPTAAPLTVSYTVQGTAANGVDYVTLPGTVTFPAGAASVEVLVQPYGNVQTFSSLKSVMLSVGSGLDYATHVASSATVSISYNPGSLYLSNLRVPTSAAGSLASGVSSLQLSSDEKFALINLSFSNLSSAQTVAYVRLGNVDDSGAAFLFQIPSGQASAVQWDIRPSGALSAADIVTAIKEGRVFVSIETASFPTGELRGLFARSTGSATFTPPVPAPAFNIATAPTPTEAARFLTQATFGPTSADLNALVSKGYSTWLDEQFAKPASLSRAAVMNDFAANNAGGQDRDAATGLNRRPGQQHRLNLWWRNAVNGEDQLRQRMAFALSQIFVVSDQNGTVNAWQEGAAQYYDVLVQGAFGNYRQLLENVTLNPMMGIYLSHLRNARATGSALPDENYAREVMQLFSIGLNELNPDGTLRLDAQGLPIPTYNQTTISETAKVFTGWGYSQSYTTTATLRGGGGRRPDGTYPDFIEPMRLFADSHENGAKTIVTGRVLPANQGGAKDLADTLDTLFNHPNTGPFISRQLIQRFVTSNPSPGYVYRVAQVFANNGAGTRGDLRAVLRALLTDYEARSPQAAAMQTYGKLKEPLLRTTALFRAFKAQVNSGRFLITNSNAQIWQMALSAPTVFNFYEPGYVQPGPLAAAGLLAPEFQIFTDTTAITVPNYLYGYLYATRPTDMASNTVYLDFAETTPLAANTGQLVDHLNLLLAGGGLSSAARTRVITAVDAMPAGTTVTERIRSAAYLVFTTPEGAIQQ